MRDTGITQLTTTAFAAAALAGTVILAPTAGAQAPNPFGPRGSAQTSSSIPENVAPQQNRLVTSGINGTCYTWVAVDINPNGYPGAATYSWTTDSIGVMDCPTSATLHWENLYTGLSGTADLSSVGPGRDWGPKDPLQGVLSTQRGPGEYHTGPGVIEYTLTTGYGTTAGPIQALTSIP